jgi:hypothetical protein
VATGVEVYGGVAVLDDDDDDGVAKLVVLMGCGCTVLLW